MFTVAANHIWSAYRYLKSYAYQENLNLFLKARIAKFEDEHIHLPIGYVGFEKEIFGTDQSVGGPTKSAYATFKTLIEADGQEGHPFNQLIDVLNSETPCEHPIFLNWLNELEFRLLPKNVKIKEDEFENGQSPVFLTNNKTDKKYRVEKVNYFADAPIEIHIIEMMWSLVVGEVLDKRFTDDCYGNRISDQARKYRKEFYRSKNLVEPQGEIFKRYIEQYSQWRDQAIDEARECTQDNNDTAIFLLDLKSYFYNVSLDFSNIHSVISKRKIPPKKIDFEIALCELLEAIHNRYAEVIGAYHSITHPDVSNKVGLPIGFASSSILANWHLRQFDRDIIKQIPSLAYYGRYVDDLIFVFKNPDMGKTSGDVVRNFVAQYFNGFLEYDGRKKLYSLDEEYHRLPIQADKIILHFFDKDHTLAGLEIFKQELDERSSAFRFLPNDQIDAELEKFAYDILYDGSANKFRSIVGLAENETELSKFLSSHIIAHRLCEIDSKKSSLDQIERFFKGKNAIRFSRLWEKVFSYAVIKNEYEFTISFYEEICRLIKKTVFESGAEQKDLIAKVTEADITLYLRTCLSDYLDISVSLPLALLSPDDIVQGDSTEDFTNIGEFYAEHELYEYCPALRSSNMIRHNYVTWSLLNFTDFNGHLMDVDFYATKHAIRINNLKLALSPRFIHFDEWQVLHAYTQICGEHGGNVFADFLEKTSEEYSQKYFQDEFPVHVSSGDNGGGIHINQIMIDDHGKNNSPRDTLKVAIANMKIEIEDIENGYRRDRTPNVSLERQQLLYEILNQAEKQNVQMLVLPEVSVPVSWLPFMVSHARRHQMAIIFGLEHWVINKTAYNLIVEALPFKVSNKYNSCLVSLRVKNHYAPKEKHDLESVRLKLGEPDENNFCYHLTDWGGIRFAAYNCFELANIEHRSLFRSDLDLLVACVWNKDTSYYDHILESAVRDLFCYVIQSNTSQYGGSCVLKPSSSVDLQVIKVKGGDNGCILTTTLDIKSLRSAQYKSLRDPDDPLKPTPPGYENEKVLYRPK